MISIGFILLTHTNEPQALRLVHALNQLFDHPPIACHHDFAQTHFDTSRFPGNVQFVRPHVNTQWGTISLVHATLRALRLLYSKHFPDWFYLLSGSDYPIQNGRVIREELANSRYDAYAPIRRIDHTRIPKPAKDDGRGLDSPSYQRLAYQRYIARALPIPSWKHPFHGPAAKHLHLLNPRLLRPFHSFSDSFHCYAGSQWFAASSRAAQTLLAPENDHLLKYFAGRFPPDEAFCPTVLGNSDLQISHESKHYIQWEQGHHPRSLDERDLPRMLASRTHFARKFMPDAPVLNVLDQHLGIDAVGARTQSQAPGLEHQARNLNTSAGRWI